MSEFNCGIILGTLVHRARGYKRFRNEVIMSSHRKSSAMEAAENREYGIVLKNVVVHSKRRIPSTLIGGTTVVIHSLCERAMVSKAVDDSRSYSEEVYRCPLDALIILERSAWDVIVAVPAPEERARIVQDKQLFTELLSIDEGSIVRVVTTSMDGIVTNKGFLPDLGPGVYFEVELFDDKTDSASRFSRRDAHDNCYPVSALRPVEPMCPSKKSRGSCVTPKAKNDFSIFEKLSPSDANRKEDLFTNDSKSTKNNRFNRGDRVVWKSAAGETKNAMICSRSQLGGSKLQVHLGSDCRQVSCDRSRTHNIPIAEVLTEDEYNESRNSAVTIATQLKNDVYVEDLLGIDQLDNCSPLIPTYASVLKDYGGEEKKNQSNVLRKCESRQSSDEDLTNVDDLGIGSMVQISISGEPYYGVIKFIGPVSYGNRVQNPIVAGIELEEESRKHGDGYLNGVKYFDCAPNRGTFTLLSLCRKDSRFQDSPLPSADETRAPEDFGKAVIPGVVEPIKQLENMHLLCGKYKGIQGHNNSCYLDATLFSMFIFTSVFDDLLYRPPNDADIQQYKEVQRVLREEIVNPLRKNLYVRSDRVMKLRTLLDNLTSVTGLTCEEKDPEEFLTSLVAQVLKAEPYLKLSSDHEAYYYQLFVEKDERLKLPTVQQLFQQSFITSDIKLKEVPSRLIIQMPRFGKSYKMYPRILPSQILDVTDVIENTPRVCSLCAELAHYECKECFKDEEFEECFSFCSNCVKKFHSHERRTHHKYTRITIPREFDKSTNYKSMPRHFMELFAVLCIETSHYVAFVKCGLGPDTPWCFFDSMADREGGSSGHNIPEMVLCPDLPSWLSDAGAKFFCEMPDDRHLDPYAKRLLCDAYMCLYQSTDVMMYR